MPEFQKIGSVKVSETVEFIFFLDIYKGTAYGNIRKHVDSKKFSGFTKQGIKFKRDIIQKLIKAISGANPNQDDQVLDEIKISDKKSYKVSVKDYKDKIYLDIREHICMERYNGPTKKGISIPMSHVDEVITYLNQMIIGWDSLSAPREEPSKESAAINSISRDKSNSVQGVPDEYKDFF
jgi:hypothetical protein